MSELLTPMSRNNRLYLVVLFLLFVTAYWVPLKSMAHIWLSNDDYSYGLIVPFVSAYLLWEQRKELETLKLRPSWWVLPVLCLVVLLSVYGILGSSGNISMPAVPLLIICFSIFLFGLNAAKAFWLPLAFLFFMVPLPAFIERTLGMFLKEVSTQLGGAVIRLFGISVNISGNIIDLGVTKLQVVDACNGMRFLMPLLAIGVLYAHFFVQRRWQKICCVIATIPIAIVSNGIRIGLTGVLSNYFGKEAAEGFFHDFEGWVIFMVAFVLLFLFGQLLRLLATRLPLTTGQTGECGGHSPDLKGESGSGSRAILVSIVLLAIVTLLSLSTKALPAMKIKGGIGDFPLEFGQWKGKTEFVTPKLVADSGAEEAFSAKYIMEGAHPVSLYLGFRSTAFLENENFFHSPTVCLPSAGWENSRTFRHVIGRMPKFGSLPVTVMQAGNLGERYLVYFWFQTKSRVTHDKNINRFHLARHAIERDNTYDLFVRTITPVAPQESIGDAEARMDDYVREMMGIMTVFLNERVM